MLTERLSHIITNQLRQEPIVVLPGFGGFVKDNLPAELNQLHNRISPPRKTIVFNAKLSHNDGMLLAAIAQELEIPYKEADTWLTDVIAEIRFLLANNGSLEMAGLGKLSLTTENSLEFEAVEVPEIQTEFFGLKPVAVSPVELDNMDKVKDLVAADGPVATTVRTLPIKKVVRYAAAAAAVGFLMWMPIQQGMVDNGKMLVHQLNPFSVSTEAAYQTREFNANWISKGFEQKDLLSDKFNHEYLSLQLTDGATNTIVVKTDAVPSKEVDSTIEDPSEEVVEIDNSASEFKVIAATFKSKSEAADYVAKMIKRGFGAEYAGKDSQGHMVAYGTYDSLEDANKMLKSVSLSNKEARIVSGS